ncbi:MAG: hypothetical protein Q9184_007543 [Pyrenodesmia sp. 2 TL-2023]
MSGFEIAAGIVTFISASRKLADGISRLSALRHAPDVLLALNNEVADLQCVLEDLDELVRQSNNTPNHAVPPGFERAVQKTKKVLLDLEELFAYELTTFDDRTGRLRVDRSAWLQTQNKVQKAQHIVQQCRLELSTAVSLLSSATSIESQNQIHRFGVSFETFTSENSQLCQDISQRMAGMESRLDGLVNYITGPYISDVHTSQPDGVHDYPEPGLKHEENVFSNVPAIASLSDDKFPRWFWYRAVNIGFSYAPATGPELLLRFPCVRPAHCDWFIFARMGDAEGLKRLLTNKQASGRLRPLEFVMLANGNPVHDIDATFGLSALHDHSMKIVSQQCRMVDTTSVDEILEAPPLHITYGRQGFSPAFRVALKAHPLSSLEEKDAIGETLLFKAVRLSDLPLGEWVDQMFLKQEC